MGKPRMGQAFSIIELVIVLVIIGVIAAIAVPRLTRGATNASATALAADLAALRNAVELYRAEHEGSFPTVANFVNQLTQFSDTPGTGFGAVADVGNGIVYGPYLKAIPPLPVGSNKGATGVAHNANPATAWYYTETTGEITANVKGTLVDKDGKAYNAY